MDGLRDTSRQLIPNLGEWFKQFKTSRVIRGIKIFLQSTWSYKNIQKTMFRLEISQILTKFTKYWGLINFSWNSSNYLTQRRWGYENLIYDLIVWGMESECMNPNNKSSRKLVFFVSPKKFRLGKMVGANLSQGQHRVIWSQYWPSHKNPDLTKSIDTLDSDFSAHPTICKRK